MGTGYLILEERVGLVRIMDRENSKPSLVGSWFTMAVIEKHIHLGSYGWPKKRTNAYVVSSLQVNKKDSLGQLGRRRLYPIVHGDVQSRLFLF